MFLLIRTPSKYQLMPFHSAHKADTGFLKRGAFISLALMLSACSNLAPFRAVAIGSASTSQTLCTAAFISKLDPVNAYRDEVRPAPGMGLIAWALRYSIDTDRKEVVTSIAGMATRRAVYREGLGCLIDFGNVPNVTWIKPVSSNSSNDTATDPFPSLAAKDIVTAKNTKILAAIESAFAEPDQSNSNSARRTQAVVIVHKGQLIAERYAHDIGIDTPLPGHSISKSVTDALIGSLALHGKLDPAKPLAIPQWSAPGDPRARINLNVLLSMSSGLPGDEYAGGWDESTRMWFAEPDPYSYSVSVAAANPVAAQWNYSNLGYTIASRMIRDATGGGASDVLNYAHRELFVPLGIKTAVLNFDNTQTPSGANLFFASARDWARFGLLYLADGKIAGKQVLPPNWVASARTSTLETGYGRGFWLNNTSAPHPFAGHWGMPGAPKDAYFARGYLGQFIVIIPSLDLVVVRLGISYRRGGDIQTVGKMVSQIVEALNGV